VERLGFAWQGSCRSFNPAGFFNGNFMVSLDFILGGHAIFTIEPAAEYVQKHECRKHYGYKIQRSKRGGKETWFINLLVGRSYCYWEYIGILDRESGNVILTKKSKRKYDSIDIVILRRVLKAYWEGRQDQIEAAGWGVYHKGQCGRCGRELTVPESIKSGFGPECIKYVGS
jgi:hypothetical protein